MKNLVLLVCFMWVIVLAIAAIERAERPSDDCLNNDCSIQGR